MKGQYFKLRVGDVRQEGDEVRHLDVRHNDSMLRDPLKGQWEPVQMIGQKILASDLMIAEFGRPHPA